MYSLVYPTYKSILVRIIGSKKYEIDPIILLLVAGMDILITFLISLKLILKSVNLILFLGKYNIITICDTTSHIALTIMIKHIVCIIPILINLLINNNISSNLDACSIKLDNIYGNIFCLPQKYPLIIEDTLINGTIIPRQIIG
jgi:hypothetical protein